MSEMNRLEERLDGLVMLSGSRTQQSTPINDKLTLDLLQAEGSSPK